MRLHDRFAGCFLTYPDLTGKRQAEGGRRIRDVPRPDGARGPLVSVVTVCWNSAATIDQTIRSIIAQDYDNVEYVIVDGNSSDGTLDIIRNHAEHIDYFVSEPDKGIYDAMNKGIELAQGAFILLLNSDDWYEPDAVRRLVEAKMYSGCDFTGCLARYVNADGSSHVLPSMSYDSSVLLRMPLRHETMLIPATLYDRIGRYDTGFPIIGDFDLTVRLYQAGATYYELREPLLNFRTSGVSNTALDRLHDEHRRLLARVFPFLTPEEVHRLGDHSVATPDDFIDVANAHADQPGFVRAVRAMIRDFGRLWGGPWAAAPLHRLAKDGPLRYPKVSVVMPVYNAAATIVPTLDSALSQDLDDFEILCVNDCSTDDSAAIIADIAARDPRIRLLDNPQNLGPGGSRNAGIRAARGDYVFFLDADDDLPPGALRRLHEAAVAHGSTIVRGAFRVERPIHGEMVRTVKYPAGVSERTVGKTSLADMPGLLSSTEGHWAGLYDRDFAETILYPEGFRMGEDSLFLIKALAFAPVVTLIPDVVYVYQDSAGSAMNTYTFEKYMQDVQWRRMAWGVLDAIGQRDRGDYFLFDYWNPPFFATLEQDLSPEQHRAFYQALYEAFCFAGNADLARCTSPVLRPVFLDNMARLGLVEPPPAPLQIAILTSSDSGGAGIASQRCMAGLRAAGEGAFSITIFKGGQDPNVFTAPLSGAAAALQGDREALWNHWLSTVSVGRKGPVKSRARELFSRIDSIVDPVALGRELAKIDVIHLHWTVGMIDYPRISDLLGDKPVVWTLHDMNAFTGGCHYSEGCTGYRDQCRDCPLLEGDKSLAHEAWKAKRAAYDKLKNLQIICPSQWLADCARESSLFGDRDIHVVPNLMPVDRFVPTNRLVARLALGLPLDRKYIVFGADSLNNTRKGGQILADSLALLKERGLAEGVEGLFFGSSSLEAGIPAHNMGYVSDPSRLSLIYAAADVFAFPSLEDNAPQTPVEALLSGTPVVGFPVGNVPDLIRHLETGYIAGYGDAADFADGLAWALDNPKSAESLQRGLRGHVFARSYHEPKVAIDRHVEVLRGAAGG